MWEKYIMAIDKNDVTSILATLVALGTPYRLPN
jgi:hypothetical protein